VHGLKIWSLKGQRCKSYILAKQIRRSQAEWEANPDVPNKWNRPTPKLLKKAVLEVSIYLILCVSFHRSLNVQNTTVASSESIDECPVVS
jgi:hypothetical protein